MKFYYFDESDFEYTAIIWAKDEVEAMDKFDNKICDIDMGNKVKPSVIDVDEVFDLMVKGGFDGDRRYKEIGQIGRLHEIITRGDAVVVMHNCD